MPKFIKKLHSDCNIVQYCHGGISVCVTDRNYMHVIHIISPCPSVDECYTLFKILNMQPCTSIILFSTHVFVWKSHGLHIITSDLPVSQSLVDGAWSKWGPWGVCTDESGAGRRQRERRCDNPPPAFGGHDCPGSPIETEPCEPCEFQMKPDGKISLKCKCSVSKMTNHKTMHVYIYMHTF